jgi:hypothetical protein
MKSFGIILLVARQATKSIAVLKTRARALQLGNPD